MMTVPVTPGASPRFGVPTALFAAEIPYIWVEDARNHYDVTRDGEKFLVVLPLVDPRSAPFTIMEGPAATRGR